MPGCFKPGRRMEDFEMVPQNLYQKKDLTSTFCFNYLIFKVDEVVSLCLEMLYILQAEYTEYIFIVREIKFNYNS